MSRLDSLGAVKTTELNFAELNFIKLMTVFYTITLTLLNFSRLLGEIGAIRLASVSGLFASFKHQNDILCSRQTPLIFHVDRPFSWQSMDLFLGLFSGFGRSLIWEVDDIVEFIQICSHFMVNERFVNDMFRATFPPNYCHSFQENQFCEVLFALKSSSYLCLARDLMYFASHEYEEIFIFQDLVTATSAANFQRLVERRFNDL